MFTTLIPEIEAFADIGEFFEQPMRTCSSGMFMRVVFSTALYVDPEILILDEALSVGDAKFEEKCFRRFWGLQEAGKTILFVTHDRSAVPRHCNLGVLLHRGELVEVGDPGRIAELYGELVTFGYLRDRQASTGGDGCPPALPGPSAQPASDIDPIRAFTEATPAGDRCSSNPTYNRYEHRFGNRRAGIVDYLLVAKNISNPANIYAGDQLDIHFKVRYHDDLDSPIVGIIFKNKEGVIAYGVNTEWLRAPVRPARAGDVRVYRFTVEPRLCAGDWFIDLAVAESTTELCDNRGALVHIYLMESRQYVGLARLDARFSELENLVGAPTPHRAAQ